MKTNWQTKKLGEVCDFYRGLTYSKKDEVDFSDSIVLRATNVDLENHILDFSKLRYIDEKITISENKKIKKGSLIICTASGSKKHLGKVALVEDDLNYAFGGFMGQLTPHKNLNSKYFFYNLISDNYKNFIDKLSSGVNINNLKFSDLRNLEIPFPPLPTQTRIVKILDKAFAEIETAKKNAERNLRNAKELFESYLQSVFANKNWEKKKLGEVCEKTSNIKWQDYKKEKFKYIDLSAVSRNDLKITSSVLVDYKNAPSRAKKIIKKDDVIFATTRPTLKRITRIFNEYNNQICSTGFTVLRANKDKVFPEVIFYFLQTSIFMENMEKLQRGASYPAVSDRNVKNQIISFPKPFATQKQIVSKLDALSASTRKLEKNYQRKIDDLEELKKSVLKKAFDGELLNNRCRG